MKLIEGLAEFGRRFRLLLVRRARFDREMEEEMRLHLELRAREIREAGAGPDEALYAAQRRFGNTLRLREEIRQAWGWTWLENSYQDVRYGLRRLRKSPGFTTVAVLTLALGIGANTAIFTLVHAIMLKPLPVSKPDELWSLGDDQVGGGGGGFRDDVSSYSYALYKYLREHTTEFSELAAFEYGFDMSVRRNGDARPAEHCLGEFVSGNYFKTLGVGVFAGRTITDADDQPNSPAVAVMSYRTWQERFGADPTIVGSMFTLKGIPTTVVGIAPAGFFGESVRADPPDFWIPLNAEPLLNRESSQLNRWNEFWLYAIGRLRPGWRPAAVQAHVNGELRQWLEDNYLDPRYRQNIPRQHIVLTSARGGTSWTRNNYADGLGLLMAVSSLVLLIACANIANLLLARSTTSRLQTAVRVALGATRGRIIQQALTEGVLLAFLGGAAGIWVAFNAARWILLLAFRGATYVPIDPRPSIPVLAFALTISLLTGLICSLIPGWRAARVQPADPMRGAGHSTRNSSGAPQKSLVVVQAALSLVLLVGAGLLTKSLWNLTNQQFGFQTQGRVIVAIALPTQYTHDRLGGFYARLEQRLKEIPGVVSASFSMYSPMDGRGWGEPVSINGQEIVRPLRHGKWPWQNRVSAHYFETVGTRILRGRAIDEHDTPYTQHVAVVTESFARTFFPNEEPIGKYFGIEEPGHSGDYEIVGVAEDTKYAYAKDDFDPMFFLPLLQEEGAYQDSAQAAEQYLTHYIGSIQLRVAGALESTQHAIRQALDDVDPNLTIRSVRSFNDQVSLNFTYDELIARLTTLYGLLALVLASIGLYGVVAYNVTRRIKEIGIRMALGADRNRVAKMVLRGAMSLIALGLLIGIPIALAGGRLIASQLFGVKVYDPVVFEVAIAVLAVCAAVAAVGPARRAASIDPMQALRTE